MEFAAFEEMDPSLGYIYDKTLLFLICEFKADGFKIIYDKEVPMELRFFSIIQNN